MIICGIYKITSPTGRVYIGQSKDIHNRWMGYKRCRLHQTRLYYSLKKYGPDSHNFEILESCSSDKLNEREIFYILDYRNNGHKLLNIASGGIGGSRNGMRHHQKTKERIRESLMGRPISENALKSLYGNKRGIANRGKVRNQDNRNKISASLKLRTDNKGEGSKQSKLTNIQVIEIRDKYIPRLYPSRKLAIEYGLSKTNVLDIVNRKIWTHI